MNVRHLDYLRSLDPKNLPGDFGAKLVEALVSIQTQATNLEQQTNGNPKGQPNHPPQINGLNVQAQNGHFQISIVDNNPIYRDVHYYLEHADNPNFTNPHVIHLGHTRNHNLFLGSVTRYFRAYSSYASSAPGAPVYHGTQTQPAAVSGGGSVGGPSFLTSQGSGTGRAGQGLQGPGTIPFRTATGAPPTR